MIVDKIEAFEKTLTDMVTNGHPSNVIVNLTRKSPVFFAACAQSMFSLVLGSA
jgi:hypothetical protein